MKRHNKGDATQIEIAKKVRKWGRAACCLGLALGISIGSVTPFLYGHSLHNYWEPFGVGFVVISMGLLLIFLYSAAITVSLLYYGRSLRKIDKEFASGGHKF